MSWRREFAKIIREDFEKRVKKNYRFSQRAYSEKLGLSASTLSEILRNSPRWKISSSRAAQVLKQMTISSAKRNRILVMMGEGISFEKEVVSSNQQNLLISNWYYVPLLNSFELPRKHRNLSVIAEKLGLRRDVALRAVNELIKIGLLEKDEAGEIFRNSNHISSSDDITDEEMRRFVHDNLELSQKLLLQQDTSVRDFTSLTFVGSKKKLDLMKTVIRELYAKASVVMDEGEENDTLYRLSVQLHPLEFK